MKLIECLEDLQSWEEYQDFLKPQLKLLEASGEPFFVSKEKVDFEIGGKSWSGFALLAGPKGAVCARKLQKEGLIFREGTCSKQGNELRIDGLDRKLVKEAAKTLKKLLIGFKIAGAEEEAGDATESDGAGAAASDRKKKVDELAKLKNNLDRLFNALNK